MRRAGPARGLVALARAAGGSAHRRAGGRMRTDASGPSTEKRNGRTPLRFRDGQRDL